MAYAIQQPIRTSRGVEHWFFIADVGTTPFARDAETWLTKELAVHVAANLQKRNPSLTFRVVPV